MNKIPYTYIEYDNEGHGIANVEKRLNLYYAIEQFLEKHMMGVCANCILKLKLAQPPEQ